MTAPTLVTLPSLGVSVAAYTDGFDFYLASEELSEIAAACGNAFPRLSPRPAGGWQVQTGPANRRFVHAVALSRAVINGRVHFLTGEHWPWPVLTAPLTVRRVTSGPHR